MDKSDEQKRQQYSVASRHCHSPTPGGDEQPQERYLVVYGLPRSGKSTLAHIVEESLHRIGCQTFVLDGDNVRHGLSSDLSFSHKDRAESIRRIGELTKLFNEAGVIVLAAFISPYKADREMVRNLHPHGDFIEIFLDCPLGVCEQRDVKGLYKKAKAGEIKEYTGISSPYEKPENSELILNTATNTIEECAKKVLVISSERGIIIPKV